jgi:hypothetical protein
VIGALGDRRCGRSVEGVKRRSHGAPGPVRLGVPLRGSLTFKPGGSKSRKRIRSTNLRVNLPKQCLPRVTWGLDGSSSDGCLPLAASAVRRCCSLEHPGRSKRFCPCGRLRSGGLSGWFSDTARGHCCRPIQVILFRADSEVYFRVLRVGLTLPTPQSCARFVSRASGIWGHNSTRRKWSGQVGGSFGDKVQRSRAANNRNRRALSRMKPSASF